MFQGVTERGPKTYAYPQAGELIHPVLRAGSGARGAVSSAAHPAAAGPQQQQGPADQPVWRRHSPVAASTGGARRESLF